MIDSKKINPTPPRFSFMERTGTIARISPSAVECHGTQLEARAFSVSIYPHALDLLPEDPDPWPVPAVVLTVRVAGGHALRLGFSGGEARELVVALTDAGQQSMDRICDYLDLPREPFMWDDARPTQGVAA